MTLSVRWIDRHREPKAKPNPLYPNGIDLDLSSGASATCQTSLPYPAKRIGYYLIQCDTCGLTTIVTTAGRPDDPRSINVACKRH